MRRRKPAQPAHPLAPPSGVTGGGVVEVSGPPAEDFLELEMRAGEYFGEAVVVPGAGADGCELGLFPRAPQPAPFGLFEGGRNPC